VKATERWAEDVLTKAAESTRGEVQQLVDYDVHGYARSRAVNQKRAAATATTTTTAATIDLSEDTPAEATAKPVKPVASTPPPPIKSASLIASSKAAAPSKPQAFSSSSAAPTKLATTTPAKSAALGSMGHSPTPSPEMKPSTNNTNINKDLELTDEELVSKVAYEQNLSATMISSDRFSSTFSAKERLATVRLVDPDVDSIAEFLQKYRITTLGLVKFLAAKMRESL